MNNHKGVIIHIVHFYSSPGGIELTLSNIIKFQSEINFKVFTIRPPVTGLFDVYEKFEVIRETGSKNNFLSLIRLWSYARRNKNDIFHLFNTGPFYLFVVRLAGVNKIVYSIRGTVYWKNIFEKIFRKLIWKISLNKKIILISNSEYSKDIFNKKIKANLKIQILYNPISFINNVPPVKKNINNLIKIIYVGRFTEGKNLFLWIDLAFNIHNEIPETVFELFGYGHIKEELTKRIKELKAEQFIKVKGFRKKIENVYNNSDVLLFLSKYESFGNVVVESILNGTPVITSAIPSMKEIFRNYPDFLVNLDQNLEKNVINKLKNLDHLKTLVPIVAEEFNNRFSFQQHLKKIKSIYNSFNLL